MPYIVVFDTNILLSGAGWRGKPYECIKLARTGLIEGLTCKEILQELSEKLEFRLKFSPEQVTDTIIDLLTCLRLVTITEKKSGCGIIFHSFLPQKSKVSPPPALPFRKVLHLYPSEVFQSFLFFQDLLQKNPLSQFFCCL